MQRFTNHELKVIADCLSDRIDYALSNYNPQACLEVTQQLCPILDKICEAYGSLDADSFKEPPLINNSLVNSTHTQCQQYAYAYTDECYCPVCSYQVD